MTLIEVKHTVKLQTYRSNLTNLNSILTPVLLTSESRETLKHGNHEPGGQTNNFYFPKNCVQAAVACKSMMHRIHQLKTGKQQKQRTCMAPSYGLLYKECLTFLCVEVLQQ